jgi:hypothetical protein
LGDDKYLDKPTINTKPIKKAPSVDMDDVRHLARSLLFFALKEFICMGT